MKTINRLKDIFVRNRTLIKQIAIAGICILFLLCMALYTYVDFVKKIPDRSIPKSIIYNRATNAENESYFGKGDCLEQEIQGNMNGMSGLVIYANISSKDTMNYNIQLLEAESGKIVEEWWNAYSEKEKIELDLTSPISPSNECNQYKLVINTMDDMPNSTIKVSDADTYYNGKCYYNGKELIGDINFEIMPYEISYVGVKIMYILVIVIMLVSLIISFLLVYNKKCVELIFLNFMLLFGIAYLFVLVPYSAPDEPMHFATAYHISNELLGKAGADDKFIKCRLVDSNQVFDCYPGVSAYAEVTNSLFEKVDDNENSATYLLSPYITGVPKFAHLPQALGITLARLLKLSYSNVILFSEFFALLFYVILTFISIKIIPYGKYILLSISATPMVLQLATSCSYDIITIALAYIYISYFLYLINSNVKIQIKQSIILLVLTVLVAPCKFIYSILAFLVILIPNKNFYNKLHCVITKIALPIGAIVVGFLPNIQNVPSGSNGEYIVEWAGERGYTVTYVLQHIKQVIILFAGTIHDKIDFYITSILGKDLGWFDLHVPVYLIMLMFGLIILAVHADSGIKIRWQNRLLYILLFVGIVLLSCATMLLSWTPLSYHSIEGVQGRYFLPALPLFLISFMNEERNYPEYGDIVVVGAGMVNFMVIISLFESIAAR